MKKIKNLFHSFIIVGAILTGTVVLNACGDDDDLNPNPNPDPDPDPIEDAREGFFLSVNNEDGDTEYIMLVDNIESGQLAISENIKELESSGYTWIFDTDPSSAIGLIYNQGDPGVGLGFGINADGTLNDMGSFQITSRFASYGFFGNYALTSVGGQTLDLTHADGTPRTDGVTFNLIDLNNKLALSDKTIPTLGITGRIEEQATFSGVVDMGDGTFLTGLVVSQAIDESATGGSSSGTVNYPDSVWVARLNADLEVVAVYGDDRISYSSARFRSQYYSQIGKTDDGTIYIFSGAYDSNTTHKPGGLKLNSSLNGFDSDYVYYFGEDYRFKRVWYISDHYFLVEFYNEPGIVTSTLNPSTKYGVVDMKAKTFNWISGLPNVDQILDTGLPMGYDGKMYFPISMEGEFPAIYIINPATATATKGLSISGSSHIRAVGRLVE